MGEVRRHGAERLGVVGDDRRGRRARATSASGPSAVADQHLAAGGRAEAPRRLLGEQLALGGLGRAHDERQLAVAGSERDVGDASPSRTRALSVVVGRGRGRGRVGVAERLLQAPQRVAQLELAEDLAQPRAVGLARRLGREVDVDAGTSRWIVASCLEIARVVGVLDQVLLALGARDLVDVRRARVSRSPKRCSSSLAVLSPIPGTPGMLSDVSPLRP